MRPTAPMFPRSTHRSSILSRPSGRRSEPLIQNATVVLVYAPLIERRLRSFRKPHCGSVRIDETYIKIRGQWRYLYRAIDKHGVPVDFLLTAKRDLEAAKRFFRKMLKGGPLLAPDRIGTDGAAPHPPAHSASQKK